MDRKMQYIILALVALLIVFVLISLIGGAINQNLNLKNTGLTRFLFTGVGLLIAFGIYYFTRLNPMWAVGTREVVFMSIGAALYAVLSYLFNGTVFAVPSVSQVALRPAVCIPMFFGYTFGPVVGLFTGAVGNMFGDALTGFGLSPQWSVGNGLIGLIAGLVFFFKDKKRSMDVVLIVSAALAAIALLIYALNSKIANMMYFKAEENIFGDQQITIFAGVSIVVGFVLVLAVRFGFAKNIELGAAVTWSMLGNLIGLGFAAISDIWVNGYSLPTAIVGEFLPSAGPNLIFAAILVPLLVVAYAAVQRQSGR
jgi:uncharacterized membrane protein